MKVVQADITHLPHLTPLYHAYRAFYGLTRAEEAVSGFLTERLVKQDSVIFIAEMEDGKVAGFLQLFPSFSIYNLGRYFVLNDLFVAEAYRGKGIGKRLIKAAQEYCKTKNGRGLLLETGKENFAAQALYTAIGFKPMDEVVFMGWENEEAQQPTN